MILSVAFGAFGRRAPCVLGPEWMQPILGCCCCCCCYCSSSWRKRGEKEEEKNKLAIHATMTWALWDERECSQFFRGRREGGSEERGEGKATGVALVTELHDFWLLSNSLNTRLTNLNVAVNVGVARCSCSSQYCYHCCRWPPFARALLVLLLLLLLALMPSTQPS